MGKKKGATTSKNEQSSSSTDNNAGPSSSQIATEYSFSDLDSRLKSAVERTQDFIIEDLEYSLNQAARVTVTAATKSKFELAVIYIEKTVQLVLADEKIKLLKNEYNNRDYYLNLFYQQLGLLNVHLGHKEKAQAYFNRAFNECNHPTLIQTFMHMRFFQLLDLQSEAGINQVLKLIEQTANLSGTAKQKKIIADTFVALGYEGRQEAIINLSNLVYKFYITAPNLTKIETLLTFLSTSSPTITKYASVILKSCINEHLKKSQFEEIDRLMQQFQPLVSVAHYELSSGCMARFIEENEYAHKLCLNYLEKAVTLGSTQAKLNLARILTYSGSYTPNTEDKLKRSRGLKFIIEVEKISSKLNTQEAKKYLGDCYYQLGQIYELGLLEHDPLFPQSDILALEYFKKAIELDFIDASRNMAMLYKHGKGFKQDLAMSERLILKLKDSRNSQKAQEANGYKDAFWQLELADLRLMQAAEPANKPRRTELLNDGINQISFMLDGSIIFPEMLTAQALSVRASLYFSLDTGLGMGYDNEQLFVTSGFNREDISYYNATKEHSHVEMVRESLLKAGENGNEQALLFLGVLYHNGNYLEQNLDKAEECYTKCINNNQVYVSEEYADFCLLRSSQATSSDIKEQYLLKALIWHRTLIENAKSTEIKALLEGLFSDCLKSYQTQTAIKYKRPSNNQHQGTLLLSGQTEPLDKQLKQAIQATQTFLVNGETNTNPSFEQKLLDLCYKITLILKNSKSEVPMYSNKLTDLNNLQQKLQLIFLTLSVNAQVELIKYCCQWPLVIQKNGALANMLLLTRPDQLKPAQKTSLLLAIAHLKQQDDLLNNELSRFLVKNINPNTIDHISTAARLIYLYALIHANTKERSTAIIEEEFKVHHSFLINYLNSHCWDSNTENMSQIYHGLSYLRLAYPDLLINIPPELHRFMQLNHELLKSDNAVTISNNQQRAYNLLSDMDANFKHEQFVGNRRVDFYNPVTKEIVLFHGPSHYLYLDSGAAHTLTPATVFCEQMLRKQGYLVLRINYFDWDEATTQTLKIKLMQSIIPSLKDWQPKEIKQMHMGSTIRGSQSSASFWNKFKLNVSDSESNLCDEATSLGFE